MTLEDLEIAMRSRKLPRRYAKEFMRRTRSHLFSKSFGWKQFLSLMEQKEPTILRAYNTLCLSKSGTLQKNQILASLKSAGLPANEDNAVAMMRFLNADTEGSISYGHFRNFMLLLPSDRLQDDPRFAVLRFNNLNDLLICLNSNRTMKMFSRFIWFVGSLEGREERETVRERGREGEGWRWSLRERGRGNREARGGRVWERGGWGRGE